jgi:hypothetical protein
MRHEYSGECRIGNALIPHILAPLLCQLFAACHCVNRVEQLHRLDHSAHPRYLPVHSRDQHRRYQSIYPNRTEDTCTGGGTAIAHMGTPKRAKTRSGVTWINRIDRVQST